MNLDLHIFRSAKFKSVVDDAIAFFETTPPCPLPVTPRFPGCGVYALYYVVKRGIYAPLGLHSHEQMTIPIYVGKAVPTGWRTGRSRGAKDPNLYVRLREHARSIDQAENLDVTAFRCRFALLNRIETDLIVPIEAELIRRYMPL